MDIINSTNGYTYSKNPLRRFGDDIRACYINWPPDYTNTPWNQPHNPWPWDGVPAPKPHKDYNVFKDFHIYNPIDEPKAVTPAVFVEWLRGFLDMRDSLTPAEVARIKEKLEEC